MSENVIIDTKCIKCRTLVFITVTAEDLEKRKNGAMVQDAFPYLTADQRELLVSGYCGKCFDNIFL